MMLLHAKICVQLNLWCIRATGIPLFVQEYCTFANKPGITLLCWLVACLQKSGYGDADNCEDKYLQISDTVLNESVKAFTCLIVEKFVGSEYLNRCPSEAEKKSSGHDVKTTLPWCLWSMGLQILCLEEFPCLSSRAA